MKACETLAYRDFLLHCFGNLLIRWLLLRKQHAIFGDTLTPLVLVRNQRALASSLGLVPLNRGPLQHIIIIWGWHPAQPGTSHGPLRAAVGVSLCHCTGVQAGLL